MHIEHTEVQEQIHLLLKAAKEQAVPITLPADELFIKHLSCYLELLLQWNKVMNLVGPYTWKEILDYLLVDSFYLASFLDNLNLIEEPQTWDLGAGAGLPGIPLRMVWQKGSYTLIDAREKRTLFLRRVLATCPLPCTTVFQGRVEAFMQKNTPADLIISRAFLPWEKVLELVKNHIKNKAQVVFLTLTAAPDTLPAGWSIAKQISYNTGQGKRFFWSIHKN